MTTVVLAPLPWLHFHDNDGRPLSNGFLYTYVAGTTTPIVTYRDATATIANTNPIQLDFRGEASVWLDVSRIYKFVLADRNNATIWTQDNVFPGSNNNALSEAIKTADTAITNSVAPQTDPQLSVSLPTVGQYDFEIFLIFDAAAVAGQAQLDLSGVAFTFATSFGDVRGVIPVLIQGSTNNLLIGNVTTLENIFSFSQIATAPYGNIILIKGSIIAASAGTLSVQMAQVVASSITTTLRAGSYIRVNQAQAQLTGQNANAITRIYGNATTSGVETIPFAMNTLTVEMWGAGGGGGPGFGLSASPPSGLPGGGGGSGEYVRAQYSVTGMSGQPISFVIGGGGTAGMPGGTNPAQSGQPGQPTLIKQAPASAFVLDTIQVNGGGGGGVASSGGAGTGGLGGLASNPTSAVVLMNTPGNPGQGATGGAGVPGINGTGGAGGEGGSGLPGGQGLPSFGSNGLIIFYYTV